MGRHIVVIDVGSKQSYIFATNKQVLAVGASHLVEEATTRWVTDALGIDPAAWQDDSRVLVLFSGRALLHLTTEEATSMLETVTRRAIEEAPGLDIWGHVGDELPDDLTGLPAAVSNALRALDRQRARRRAPAAAGQSIPFVVPCAFTGAPASVLPRRAADARARSRGIDLAWESGRSGRDAFVSRIVGDAGEEGRQRVENAVVTASELGRGDGVSNAGWVGVIHADGNGMGQIFTNLDRAYPDGQEYLKVYRALSAATDSALLSSTRTAVEEVARVHGGAQEPSGWMLPIILGGDDAAMIVDGRYAWTFATALVRGFTDAAAAEPIFAEALRRTSEVAQGFLPRRLTMAAGLAYVKPHFPYSHANHLAEALAQSAKSLKQLDHSSIDFHVHYESSLRTLSDVRADHDTEDGVQFAGPFVVADGAPMSSAAPEDLREHGRHRLVADFEGLVDQVRGPEISNTFVHALRAACLDGEQARTALFDRVTERLDLDAAGKKPYRDLQSHATVEVPAGVPGLAPRFSRIVQAIDLADVHDPTVPPGGGAATIDATEGTGAAR